MAFAGTFVYLCSITVLGSVADSAIERLSTDKIKLEVISHFPCTEKKSWKEKLVFPNSTVADLIEEPGRTGCYKLGGDVLFKERISTKTVQVHMEISHTTGAGYEINQCYNYNQTGCGGFGSCLYCDICRRLDQANSIDLHSTHKSGAAVWITYDGKSVDCENALDINYRLSRAGLRQRPGATGRPRTRTRTRGDRKQTGRRPRPSKNLSSGTVASRIAALGGIRDKDDKERGTFVHFCLPTQEQFLAAKGITKELYDQLKADQKNGGPSAIPSKIGVFIILRFFDRDQRPAMRKQQHMIELYRDTHDGAPPSKRYLNQLTFNRMIQNDVGFVGCHRLIGNMYLS